MSGFFFQKPKLTGNGLPTQPLMEAEVMITSGADVIIPLLYSVIARMTETRMGVFELYIIKFLQQMIF